MLGEKPAPALAALLDAPLRSSDRLAPPGQVTRAGAYGDHITLLSAAHAAGLAARLRPWLAACDQNG
jgi:hypothetical protein